MAIGYSSKSGSLCPRYQGVCKLQYSIGVQGNAYCRALLSLLWLFLNFALIFTTLTQSDGLLYLLVDSCLQALLTFCCTLYCTRVRHSVHLQYSGHLILS